MEPQTKSTLAACGVCGKSRAEHEDMNHEFDIVGNLRPKAAKQPPKALSSVDIPLRLLLIDKGVITAEELTVKEASLREQLAQAGRNAAPSSNGSSSG